MSAEFVDIERGKRIRLLSQERRYLRSLVHMDSMKDHITKGIRSASFQMTEAVSRTKLSLPVHPKMEIGLLDYMNGKIRSFYS